jgi:hypothetical protein
LRAAVSGSAKFRYKEHITYNSVHELACEGDHDAPDSGLRRRRNTGAREVGKTGNGKFREPAHACGQ